MPRTYIRAGRTLLERVLAGQLFNLQCFTSSEDFARLFHARILGMKSYYDTYVSQTDWEAYGEKINRPIKSSFGYIITKSRTHLYGGIIKPDNPRGTIVWMHATPDVFERCTWMFKKLLKAGFACVFFDGRGHGLSFSETSITKGNQGEAVYTPWSTHFLRDVVAVWKIRIQADSDLRSLPVFLAGHSGGGTVALGALLQPELHNQIRGVIAVAPVFETPLSISKELGEYISFQPTLIKIPFVVPLHMLYGSSAWQHLEYGSVPLLVNRQRGWYPVQLFNTVFDTVKQLYETKGLIEEQTGTAILIIQGSFDKIVSMTATTQFFRELVEEAPNNDYHHYISDGSPHVVMEGPHRDDVMSFMTKWMKDRS